MRNLKKFTNQDTLNIWQDSDTFIKPNVVLLDKTIYFNIDGHILPYDAEIEYLESTTTQWIDTEIVPTPTTKCQIKFCNLSSTGTVIFGYKNGSDKDDYRLFNHNQYLYFDIPGYYGVAEGNRLSDSCRLYSNSTYELELGNFYVKDLTTDTTLISSSAWDSFGEISDSITLNCGIEDNQQVISSNRWYYAKIFDNNTLLLDLVPVRIGQVGYMYDKVTGQLFGNKGTGDFILGPDKN